MIGETKIQGTHNVLVVTCDEPGCGHWFQYSTFEELDPGHLREQLAAAGWEQVDERDICPAHGREDTRRVTYPNGAIGYSARPRITSTEDSE